jgi:hypothetical protein
MKVLAVSIAMTAAALATPSWAQQATTGQGDPSAARAAEGAAAARGPQLGEGNPIPDPKRTYTREERAAAHAARRGKAPAAPAPAAADAPKPPAPPKPTLGSPERAAARTTKNAEAARANKAGEIKSKGEMSN